MFAVPRLGHPLCAVVLVIAACSGDNHRGGDDAPDGGEPPALLCDDGNACTDDSVEGGACRFVPVEDGRACDDADLCTLGDACRAGSCAAGPRTSGPIAELGVVNGVSGGGFGVVGNRFLSVTGPPWSSRLALVERRESGLETVASWHGRLFVYLQPQDALVEALDSGAIAISGRGERELAIFTAEAGVLVPRGEVKLDGQLVSLTSHGKRIWMCTREFGRSSDVSLIEVGDPAAPVLVGGIRMPKDCGSVAASDDGQRIYVNTVDGVRFVDAKPLDTGGNPTLSEVIAPSAGVSTGGGLLLLREPAAVRVVRQLDHTEVFAIPEQRVLAASLAGGRLVLEGWRPSGPGLEAYVALYDAATAARLDDVVLQRVSFRGDLPPSFSNAISADGSAVITSIGQRMFELSAGRLDELRVPALTPLGRLAPAVGGVRATGYASTALVDLRDPARPVLASGGAFGRPIRFEPSIEDGSPWPQVLFGLRFDVPVQASVGNSWEPDPLAIERLQLDEDGRAQSTGSFMLPNRGIGRLLTAGGTLYRLRLPAAPSSDAALQSWPLAALGSAGEPAPTPHELTLAPTPPLGTTLDTRRSVIDVDPRTRTAVVVVGAIETGTRRAAAFWIDLAATPPAIVEEVHFDGLPDDVRVTGSRAVVSTNLELVWLERGRGVASRVTPTPETFIEHLLAFDGRTAYYAATTFGGKSPDVLGVAPFDNTGPAPTSLPLRDTAESLIETASGLVVGMPNELIVVHPRCE